MYTYLLPKVCYSLLINEYNMYIYSYIIVVTINRPWPCMVYIRMYVVDIQKLYSIIIVCTNNTIQKQNLVGMGIAIKTVSQSVPI